jgi:malonyl-CoA O-methyltransferase
MPHANTTLAERFSKASSQYDQHSPIQHQAAQHLWNWLHKQLPSQFQPKQCLDIGCGTGTLTQHLLQHYPNTPVHAIDIAPGMLQHLRHKHPSPWLHTHCLNAEHIPTQSIAPSTATLLLSNMCAQWFEHLHHTLEHWLQLSPFIAFSILLEPSFQTWKDAHTATQQPCGLRTLPSHSHILSLLEQLTHTGQIRKYQHDQQQYIEHHPNGLSFARSLRAIGAHTPTPNHRPIQLSRILKHLEHNADQNYDIGFYYLERT